MPSESARIQVAVKCRPLVSEELNQGRKSVVSTIGDKVKVDCAGKDSVFSVNASFNSDEGNEIVYKKSVLPLVQRAIDGYNISVIAFGATGGGKTHLMSGVENEPGIVHLLTKNLFNLLSERKSREFQVTASYVEILDESITDLLNPHSNTMSLRHHPYKGIFVDGCSEMVVRTGEDLLLYYNQGTRARRLGGALDINAHRRRANAIFTICIEQKENRSSKIAVRSKIVMAELAGCEDPQSSDPNIVSGTQGMLQVLKALGDGKKSNEYVPYRESKVTRLLQDAIGGNSMTLLIAAVSSADKDYQNTATTLQYCNMAKNIKNKVKMNMDDTQDLIAEMRQEIAKLRDKIASSSQPNREDVLNMENLVKDLDTAKKQTWMEKEKQSRRYQEERKINLGNKGILEWVMDSMKEGNKELQDKMSSLQKEKNQLLEKIKDKRNLLSTLKEDLQSRITDYAKFTESGKKSESETKKRVTAIHELKEKLKTETESVKQMKEQLKTVQQKQQQVRDTNKGQADALKGKAELRQMIEKEERKRIESENRAMVEAELEKSQLESASEITDIQLRAAEGKQYSTKEGADLEISLAEMKADQSVVALKLETLEQEKKRLTSELEDVYKYHREELELQQLQHYQTFKSYRETFEEQKAAIDHRYRELLEDSIQDAVFLASKNNDLTQENQSLKQYIAEMKDEITKLGGKIPEAKT